MFALWVSRMATVQKEEVGNRGCFWVPQLKEQGLPQVVLGVIEGTTPKPNSSVLGLKENMIQSPLFIKKIVFSSSGFSFY